VQRRLKLGSKRHHDALGTNSPCLFARVLTDIGQRDRSRLNRTRSAVGVHLAVAHVPHGLYALILGNTSRAAQRNRIVEKVSGHNGPIQPQNVLSKGLERQATSSLNGNAKELRSHTEIVRILDTHGARILVINKRLDNGGSLSVNDIGHFLYPVWVKGAPICFDRCPYLLVWFKATIRRKRGSCCRSRACGCR